MTVMYWDLLQKNLTKINKKTSENKDVEKTERLICKSLFKDTKIIQKKALLHNL